MCQLIVSSHRILSSGRTTCIFLKIEVTNIKKGSWKGAPIWLGKTAFVDQQCGDMEDNGWITFHDSSMYPNKIKYSSKQGMRVPLLNTGFPSGRTGCESLIRVFSIYGASSRCETKQKKRKSLGRDWERDGNIIMIIILHHSSLSIHHSSLQQRHRTLKSSLNLLPLGP